MKIKIIGAGFSGLTLAYYLQKRSPEYHQIQIIEASSGPGGLIHSKQFEGYQLETAANAILNNPELESLCEEIQIPIIPHLRASKKRYIFIQKPRKFPLPWFHAIKLLGKIAFRFIFLRRQLSPKAQETIKQWSERNLSPLCFQHLIEPGLQGIYGKNPGDLSAQLVFRSLFQKKQSSKKPRHQGSVSFHHGMGGFLSHLQKFLQQKGIQFTWETKYNSEHLKKDLAENITVILCTHAHSAAQILSSTHSRLSSRLEKIQYNDLTSATVVPQDGLGQSSEKITGFGVLFPEDQKFHSLGVLFPNDIFEGRGPLRHETWIVPNATQDSDQKLLEKIKDDRKKLYKKDTPILHFHFFHWPRAIPRYDIVLENFLNDFVQESTVFLHGNYLGEIGLGKILKRSKNLADNILQNKSTSTKEHR